ncbi:exopolysaccharide biosynthesis polyprenyl glycosylphosphotransferase [Sphingomonas sanguinis]|uniref:Exopolysaccharide biosynthesis polyprenyl glycosylphosphotransferase n=1 Tax=Sphingomonas sanguinis TaxID=33051 RepID=A0ABU5LTF4_9SPHN|nr:exopolysaccharide biosynthesis polyprenyl glycosylphosphotransferase [Sphingomonas sanguinis]MDZ7283001.1 exopolysaccharide biosynthesis polyprenyl glycosylphosphotransferase [Sphingomonas sanguinis]
MNIQSPMRSDHSINESDRLISIDNMEMRRIRCYVTLAVSDTLVIIIAFFLSNFFFIGRLSASHGITMFSVMIPIYLWIAAANGSYNGKVLREPREGAAKAVRAAIFSAASMLMIAYSFKVGAEFSRLVFWTGTLTSIIFLIIARITLGKLLLRRLGGEPFSTIIVVDGVTLHDKPNAIVIDAGKLGIDPRTDDPIHYHQLAKLIAHADRVIIACSDDKIAPWAHVLKSMAVDGEILAPDVDRIGLIGLSRYGDARTMVVAAGPLHLKDRFVKRIFDIVVSSISLIMLFPLILIIAIAIRLESPGPIMFRQQRIGRDNALFMMFKFRSMYADRCDASAATLTARVDQRVTRVGQFIRRNSIDELPQLFNVLRGEMSIVGPRPHALSARAADQLYWEIDARYRHRHAVKPGVTGLAQIRGYRGATVLTADLTNRLSSDLEYLNDWSIGRDLWILFRTIFVIRHDNAF